MLRLFIIKLMRSHQPSLSGAGESTTISSWTSSHSDAAELSAAHIQQHLSCGGKLIAQNMIKMRSVPDKNSSISDHVLDVREHGTWQPHSSNWYRERSSPNSTLHILFKNGTANRFPRTKQQPVNCTSKKKVHTLALRTYVCFQQ